MRQGAMLRTSAQNRATCSEHQARTGRHAPNIAEKAGRHAPNIRREIALTCTDEKQGDKGVMVRNFSSRTRVMRAQEKVSDHGALVALPALEAA